MKLTRFTLAVSALLLFAASCTEVQPLHEDTPVWGEPWHVGTARPGEEMNFLMKAEGSNTELPHTLECWMDGEPVSARWYGDIVPFGAEVLMRDGWSLVTGKASEMPGPQEFRIHMTNFRRNHLTKVISWTVEEPVDTFEVVPVRIVGVDVYYNWQGNNEQ